MTVNRWIALTAAAAMFFITGALWAAGRHDMAVSGVVFFTVGALLGWALL